MDNKIVDYIKTQLRKGYPKIQIASALIKAGHDPDKVEEYMKAAEKPHHLKFVVPAAIIVVFLITAIILLHSNSKTVQELWLDQNYEKAKEILIEQTIKEPDNAEAWFQLGETYLFLNELNESLKAFRIAEGISDEPSIQLGIAEVYRKQLKYNEALEIYDSLDLGYGQEAWLNGGRGRLDVGKIICLQKSGRADEAIEILKEIKKRFPGEPCVSIAMLLLLGENVEYERCRWFEGFS